MFLLGATLFFLPHYSLTLNQSPTSVVADSNGNAYIVSADPDSIDVGWLTKVDPDGQVVYRVVLSHGGDGGAIYATPDNQGNVYAAVLGLDHGYDPGAPDFFAVKLDPHGNIVYSMALGSGAAVKLAAPAVGTDGSAYFTGAVYPSQLLASTTPGAWTPTAAAAPGETNTFVIKLSQAGDRIVYSTFLDNSPPSPGAAPGYPVQTMGVAIEVDQTGSAYVVGSTNDPLYPTTPGAFEVQCPSCGFGQSLFAAKLASDGSRLVFSTYLGKSEIAYVFSRLHARMDSTGAAIDIVTVDDGTAIHSRALLADGSGMLYDNTFTPLSAGSADPGFAAALDGQGDVIVSGVTSQFNLPPSDGALQDGPATLALIRAMDSSLLYCTRLRAVGDVSADGGGGFVVLAFAGTSGQAWSASRFLPDSAPRAAVFAAANAAEPNTSSALAPGELITIYGTDVGPAAPVAAAYDANGQLPYTLAGTQVWLNGIPTPILSVAAQQAVVEVPFDVSPGGAIEVQIVRDKRVSNGAELPTAAMEPCVLEQQLSPLSSPYALALNQDGTVNSQTNPAAGGTVVSLFVNGGGAFTPTPANGMAGQANQRLVAPVTAMISVGNASVAPAQVDFAGAAAGLVGITQLNLTVPPPPYSRTPHGASTIYLTIGATPLTVQFWATAQ